MNKLIRIVKSQPKNFLSLTLSVLGLIFIVAAWFVKSSLGIKGWAIIISVGVILEILSNSISLFNFQSKTISRIELVLTILLSVGLGAILVLGLVK